MADIQVIEEERMLEQNSIQVRAYGRMRIGVAQDLGRCSRHRSLHLAVCWLLISHIIIKGRDSASAGRCVASRIGGSNPFLAAVCAVSPQFFNRTTLQVVYTVSVL